IDPLSALSWLAAGVTKWFAGRFEGTLDTLSRALELDPQGYIIHWSIGYTYALVGEIERAAAEVAWLTAAGPMVPYTWQLQSLVASLQGHQARGLAALAPVNTAP